jgi:secreted trypsin-like serine protease
MRKSFGNMPQIFSLILTMASSITACGKQDKARSHVQLTNGIEIDNSAYPAVVLLLAMDPQSHENKICTGFFVNEFQVLTAAHCVKYLAQSNPEIYLVQARLDSKGVASYEYKAKALQLIVHPEYDRDAQLAVNPNDLAVLEFAAGSAADSLRIASRSPRVNDTVTLVGYGNNENFGSSPTAQAGAGAGVKRFGQNTIKSAANGMFSMTGVAKTKANVQAGQYVATGLGDSGSPLLFNGELVALTVAGEVRQGANGQYSSLSYSIDLNSPSSHAFLNSVLD